MYIQQRSKRERERERDMHTHVHIQAGHSQLQRAKLNKIIIPAMTGVLVTHTTTVNTSQ